MTNWHFKFALKKVVATNVTLATTVPPVAQKTATPKRGTSPLYHNPQPSSTFFWYIIDGHKIIPPRTTASSLRRRFGRSASMLRSRNDFYDRCLYSQSVRCVELQTSTKNAMRAVAISCKILAAWRTRRGRIQSSGLPLFASG